MRMNFLDQISTKIPISKCLFCSNFVSFAFVRQTSCLKTPHNCIFFTLIDNLDKLKIVVINNKCISKPSSKRHLLLLKGMWILHRAMWALALLASLQHWLHIISFYSSLHSFFVFSRHISITNLPMNVQPSLPIMTAIQMQMSHLMEIYTTFQLGQ